MLVHGIHIYWILGLTIPELKFVNARTVQVNDGTFMTEQELTELGIGPMQNDQKQVLRIEEYDPPYSPNIPRESESLSEPSQPVFMEVDDIPAGKREAKDQSSQK